MLPKKWLNVFWLLAVCTLVLTTATEAYVAYDPYFGPIGMYPQYQFNPFHRYMLPKAPIPSSWQLVRSGDTAIPKSEDATIQEAADVTITKAENATVPTVGLLNAPVAPREEIPGLVAFVVSFTLIGSGTLITRRHVLTTGRIATEIQSNQLGVRALINTGTLLWPDANSEIRSIVDVYIHPGFQQSTNLRKNDIAVVRLNSPVPNVPRVHLSFDDVLPEGDSYLTYGFGQDGINGANKLRKGTLKMVPKSSCSAAYDTAELLDDQYLCLETQNAPCSGDGGIPLIKYGIQYGVGSSVINCNTGAPAVYIRVGAFKDWIAYWVDL